MPCTGYLHQNLERLYTLLDVVAKMGAPVTRGETLVM